VPVFQGSERLLTDSTPLAGSVVGLANLEPRLCAAAQPDCSATTADAVAHAVRRYGLDGAEWYANVKRELVRRKVICASTIVGGDRR
jgi:4-hydroxy-tetrahydrodipicolinate synthase